MKPKIATVTLYDCRLASLYNIMKSRFLDASEIANKNLTLYNITWWLGLRIGKNLVIRYESRYRSFSSIYCNTVSNAIHCNFLMIIYGWIQKLKHLRTTFRAVSWQESGDICITIELRFNILRYCYTPLWLLWSGRVKWLEIDYDSTIQQSKKHKMYHFHTFLHVNY